MGHKKSKPNVSKKRLKKLGITRGLDPKPEWDAIKSAKMYKMIALMKMKRTCEPRNTGEKNVSEAHP